MSSQHETSRRGVLKALSGGVAGASLLAAAGGC
jgi:hypothetical protein